MFSRSQIRFSSSDKSSGGYFPFAFSNRGDLTELASSEPPVPMLELPESELESEIRRRFGATVVSVGNGDFWKGFLSFGLNQTMFKFISTFPGCENSMEPFLQPAISYSLKMYFQFGKILMKWSFYIKPLGGWTSRWSSLSRYAVTKKIFSQHFRSHFYQREIVTTDQTFYKRYYLICKAHKLKKDAKRQHKVADVDLGRNEGAKASL